MSLCDPVADMLTRIRNAQMVKKPFVSVPHIKMHEGLLKVFLEEGYVKSFSLKNVRDKINCLEVHLKYIRGSGVIEELNRISRPGVRVYRSLSDLKSNRFYNGLGLYILSTSRGIMTDRKAIELGIGGEVICNVY